jgi:hypothetical protein
MAATAGLVAWIPSRESRRAQGTEAALRRRRLMTSRDDRGGQ